MKKAVSLLLAMAMLLCMLPGAAMATVITEADSIPLKLADIEGVPKKPVTPQFTITEVDGHTEVSVANLEDYGPVNWGYGYLEGMSADFSDWYTVEFHWNKEKQMFTSEGYGYHETLPEEYQNDVTLCIQFYPDYSDEEAFRTYMYCDVATGNMSSALLSNAGGDYRWDNYHEVTVQHWTGDGLNATYNDVTGDIVQYTLYLEDDSGSVTYNKYGQAISANMDIVDEDGLRTNCYWDETGWFRWNDEIKDIEYFVPEKQPEVITQPGPICLPYAIDTLPEQVDMSDYRFTELDNEFRFNGENITAWYNQYGVLSYYSVQYEDNTSISYNRYGQVNWASKPVVLEDGMRAFAQWDGSEWVVNQDGEQVVVDEAPLNAENYPVPYAAEYVITLPPTTLADYALDFNPMEMEPIACGAVTIGEGNSITVSDEGYKYVDAYITGVDENGDEYFDYHSLMQDSEGNWILTELSSNTIEAIEFYVGNEDGQAVFDEQGELIEFSKGRVTKRADGTYTVFGDDIYNVDAIYDENGNMVEYSYCDLDYTYRVSYDMEGNLLSYYENVEGVDYYYSENTGWEYYDEDLGEFVACDKPENTALDEDAKPLAEPKTEGIWYPNNTVCAIGLSLRDEFPGLTDKWYNVVPVDLTHDGTTVIPLVASNLFFIGKAEVTVKGDDVTVDYSLAKGYGYVKGETLKWFTSVGEITTEWLENPQSDLAFGQAVSRENDLKGQDVALLFICNRVTYRQPYNDGGMNLTRMWPNLTEWKAYRETMRGLMEKLPE